MVCLKLFISSIPLAAVLSVSFCVYVQGPTSVWANDTGRAEFSQNPVDIHERLSLYVIFIADKRWTGMEGIKPQLT